MVRETRHLWVGNLPENISEERIRDHFKRYGPVQSVKHLNGPSSDSNEAGSNNANNNNNNGSSNCCTVAFVDICSAAKAHKADHRIDDRILKTTYYEPSVASLSSGHYSSGATQSGGGGSGGSSAGLGGGGISHYPSGPSQAQGVSQTPLGSRSPRFAAGLPDEHAGYDRSSHFYETVRRDDVCSYNGPMSMGVGMRRNYPPPPETGEFGSRGGRLRSYGRVQYCSNPREPIDYRWQSAAPPPSNYRYHPSDGYGDDKLPVSVRRGSVPPSPTPSRSNHIRASRAAQNSSGGLGSSSHHSTSSSKRHHAPSSSAVTSHSSSDSGSSSRSSSTSSTSSTTSSSSSRSRSRSFRSSRSPSRSPVSRVPSSSLNCNSSSSGGGIVVPSSSAVSSHAANDKRPLAICVRNLPIGSTDISLKDGLFHDYKKHGKVTTVRIVGTGTDRYAVVCFKKAEDAEKALQASHDKRFFGVKIQVAPHEGLELDENEYRTYDVDQDEYHHKATRTLFIGNLEKEITPAHLRSTFDQFGEIIEIEIKKQNLATFAFCQYADIRSVVRAMRAMDGEHLGANRIKLGFGKCMPTRCVWLDGVVDNVSESFLRDQFSIYGTVSYLIIDRHKGQALVFYEAEKYATIAVSEMRGRILMGKKLQIDFASRECEVAFFDNLTKQGFNLPPERPWERISTKERANGSTASCGLTSNGTSGRYDMSNPTGTPTTAATGTAISSSSAAGIGSGRYPRVAGAVEVHSSTVVSSSRSRRLQNATSSTAPSSAIASLSVAVTPVTSSATTTTSSIIDHQPHSTTNGGPTSTYSPYGAGGTSSVSAASAGRGGLPSSSSARGSYSARSNRANARYDGFDDYGPPTGRSYDEYSQGSEASYEDSYERELREYAGSRYDTANSAARRGSRTTTVSPQPSSAAAAAAAVAAAAALTNCSSTGTPTTTVSTTATVATTVASPSNRVPASSSYSQYDDYASSRSSSHVVNYDGSGCYSPSSVSSPPSRSVKNRLASRSPAASLATSPSREVTLIDDRALPDPRKRRPIDLKDLVVRVSERRPPLESPVRSLGRAIESPASGCHRELYDPRLVIKRDEAQSSSGDERSDITESRSSKKMRYDSAYDKSHVLKRMLDSSDCSREPLCFRRPHDARKTSESSAPKYRREERSPQVDPRGRRLDDETWKNRDIGSQSGDNFECMSDSSAPGTPVRDERDECLPSSSTGGAATAAPSSHHRHHIHHQHPYHQQLHRDRNTSSMPMFLPLPRFAQQLRSSQMSPLASFAPNSPKCRLVRSPLSSSSSSSSSSCSESSVSKAASLTVDTFPALDEDSTILADTPVSPGPTAHPSDSEDSPLATNKQGAALEERIRALDVKYEKWGNARVNNSLENVRDKVAIPSRKFPVDLEALRSTPSAIFKSVLSRRSIFDEDGERLENIEEKYEPKAFVSLSKNRTTATITNILSTTYSTSKASFGTSKSCNFSAANTSSTSTTSSVNSSLQSSLSQLPSKSETATVSSISRTSPSTVVRSSSTSCTIVTTTSRTIKVTAASQVITSVSGSTKSSISAMALRTSPLRSLSSPVTPPVTIADIIAATTLPVPAATPINSLPGFRPSIFDMASGHNNNNSENRASFISSPRSSPGPVAVKSSGSSSPMTRRDSSSSSSSFQLCKTISSNNLVKSVYSPTESPDYNGALPVSPMPASPAATTPAAASVTQAATQGFDQLASPSSHFGSVSSMSPASTTDNHTSIRKNSGSPPRTKDDFITSYADPETKSVCVTSSDCSIETSSKSFELYDREISRSDDSTLLAVSKDREPLPLSNTSKTEVFSSKERGTVKEPRNEDSIDQLSANLASPSKSPKGKIGANFLSNKSKSFATSKKLDSSQDSNNEVQVVTSEDNDETEEVVSTSWSTRSQDEVSELSTSSKKRRLASGDGDTKVTSSDNGARVKQHKEIHCYQHSKKMKLSSPGKSDTTTATTVAPLSHSTTDDQDPPKDDLITIDNLKYEHKHLDKVKNQLNAGLSKSVNKKRNAFKDRSDSRKLDKRDKKKERTDHEEKDRPDEKSHRNRERTLSGRSNERKRTDSLGYSPKPESMCSPKTESMMSSPRPESLISPKVELMASPKAEVKEESIMDSVTDDSFEKKDGVHRAIVDNIKRERKFSADCKKTDLQKISTHEKEESGYCEKPSREPKEEDVKPPKEIKPEDKDTKHNAPSPTLIRKQLEGPDSIVEEPIHKEGDVKRRYSEDLQCREQKDRYRERSKKNKLKTKHSSISSTDGNEKLKFGKISVPADKGTSKEDRGSGSRHGSGHRGGGDDKRSRKSKYSESSSNSSGSRNEKRERRESSSSVLSTLSHDEKTSSSSPARPGEIAEQQTSFVISFDVRSSSSLAARRRSTEGTESTKDLSLVPVRRKHDSGKVDKVVDFNEHRSKREPDFTSKQLVNKHDSKRNNYHSRTKDECHEGSINPPASGRHASCDAAITETSDDDSLKVLNLSASSSNSSNKPKQTLRNSGSSKSKHKKRLMSKDSLARSDSESDELVSSSQSSDEDNDHQKNASLFQEPVFDNCFDMYDKVKSRHLKLEQKKREQERLKEEAKQKSLMQHKQKQRNKKKKLALLATSSGAAESDSDTNEDVVNNKRVNPRMVASSTDDDRPSIAHVSSDESDAGPRSSPTTGLRKPSLSKRKRNSSSSSSNNNRSKKNSGDTKPSSNSVKGLVVSDISSEEDITGKSEDMSDYDVIPCKKLLNKPVAADDDKHETAKKPPRPALTACHIKTSTDSDRGKTDRIHSYSEEVFHSDDSDTPVIEEIKPCKPKSKAEAAEISILATNTCRWDHSNKTKLASKERIRRDCRMEAIFGVMSDDSDASTTSPSVTPCKSPRNVSVTTPPSGKKSTLSRAFNSPRDVPTSPPGLIHPISYFDSEDDLKADGVSYNSTDKPSEEDAPKIINEIVNENTKKSMRRKTVVTATAEVLEDTRLASDSGKGSSGVGSSSSSTSSTGSTADDLILYHPPPVEAVKEEKENIVENHEGELFRYSDDDLILDSDNREPVRKDKKKKKKHKDRDTTRSRHRSRSKLLASEQLDVTSEVNSQIVMATSIDNNASCKSPLQIIQTSSANICSYNQGKSPSHAVPHSPSRSNKNRQSNSPIVGPSCDKKRSFSGLGSPSTIKYFGSAGTLEGGINQPSRSRSRDSRSSYEQNETEIEPALDMPLIKTDSDDEVLITNGDDMKSITSNSAHSPSSPRPDEPTVLYEREIGDESKDPPSCDTESKTINTTKASRSVISQEETLNAVAGLLASYDEYAEHARNSDQEDDNLMASEANSVVEEDSQEAQTAAQMLQSEMPEDVEREPEEQRREDANWNATVSTSGSVAVSSTESVARAEREPGVESSLDSSSSRSRAQPVEEEICGGVKKEVAPTVASEIPEDSDDVLVTHTSGTSCFDASQEKETTPCDSVAFPDSPTSVQSEPALQIDEDHLETLDELHSSVATQKSRDALPNSEVKIIPNTEVKPVPVAENSDQPTPPQTPWVDDSATSLDGPLRQKEISEDNALKDSREEKVQEREQDEMKEENQKSSSPVCIPVNKDAPSIPSVDQPSVNASDSSEVLPSVCSKTLENTESSTCSSDETSPGDFALPKLDASPSSDLPTDETKEHEDSHACSVQSQTLSTEAQESPKEPKLEDDKSSLSPLEDDIVPGSPFKTEIEASLCETPKVDSSLSANETKSSFDVKDELKTDEKPFMKAEDTEDSIDESKSVSNLVSEATSTCETSYETRPLKGENETEDKSKVLPEVTTINDEGSSTEIQPEKILETQITSISIDNSVGEESVDDENAADSALVDSNNSSVSEVSAPVQSPRGRGGRGRCRRGGRGRSASFTSDGKDDKCVAQQTTPRNKSRSRSRPTKEEQQDVSKLVNNLQEPRRSSRPKRVRRHPDMVDHDESSGRRRRGMRGVRGNLRPSAASTTLDVFEFHESDDDTALAVNKAGKKDASIPATQVKSPAKETSNEEDSRVGSSTNVRKSRRLLEKVAEDEDSNNENENTTAPSTGVVPPLTIPTSAIRYKGKESSAQQRRGVRGGRSNLATFVANVSSLKEIPPSLSLPETSVITLNSPKPSISDTLSPITPISATNTMPSLSEQQPGMSTAKTVPVVRVISSTSSSPLPISHISSMSVAGAPTVITSATITTTSTTVSSPVINFRSSTQKESDPTPLVDPVTGHLTPMTMVKEGQYIPVSGDVPSSSPVAFISLPQKRPPPKSIPAAVTTLAFNSTQNLKTQTVSSASGAHQNMVPSTLISTTSGTQLSAVAAPGLQLNTAASAPKSMQVVSSLKPAQLVPSPFPQQSNVVLPSVTQSSATTVILPSHAVAKTAAIVGTHQLTQKPSVFISTTAAKMNSGGLQTGGAALMVNAASRCGMTMTHSSRPSTLVVTQPPQVASAPIIVNPINREDRVVSHTPRHGGAILASHSALMARGELVVTPRPKNIIVRAAADPISSGASVATSHPAQQHFISAPGSGVNLVRTSSGLLPNRPELVICPSVKSSSVSRNAVAHNTLPPSASQTTIFQLTPGGHPAKVVTSGALKPVQAFVHRIGVSNQSPVSLSPSITVTSVASSRQQPHAQPGVPQISCAPALRPSAPIQHGVRRGEVSVEVVRQVPSSASPRAVESPVVSTATGAVSMNKVSVGAVSPSGGTIRRSSFQSVVPSPLMQQQQHLLTSGRPSPQPSTPVHHPSPQPAHVQPSPQASPHLLHQPSPQASPQPVLLHQPAAPQPQQQQQLVSIGGQLHQVVTTTVGGAATSVLVHPPGQQVMNVATGANVIVSRGELESIARTVTTGVQQPASLSIAVSSSHPPPAHLNKNRPPLDSDPSLQPFDMSLAPPLYRGGYYVQDPHRPIYTGAGAVLDMKMEGGGDKGQEQQQQPVAQSHVVLAQHGAAPHLLPAHHDRTTESPKAMMFNGERYYGIYRGHAVPPTEASRPPPAERTTSTPVSGDLLRTSASPYPPPSGGNVEQRVAAPHYASPGSALHHDSATVASVVPFSHPLEKYPIFWGGTFGLKNDQAKVQMHFVSGSMEVARGALPSHTADSTTLRISQRMRLEPLQLDGVARKMQQKGEHSVLVALPFGVDEIDSMSQHRALVNGFISYLGGKQAAGIVNVLAPGAQSPTFVIHIFPPCDFSKSTLQRCAPDVLQAVAETPHLLIVIATC